MIGIRNAPVLPVPFLARAMMLRLLRMRGMLSSWMGVGTVYPASVSAIKSSYLSLRAAKF